MQPGENRAFFLTLVPPLLFTSLLNMVFIFQLILAVIDRFRESKPIYEAILPGIDIEVFFCDLPDN